MGHRREWRGGDEAQFLAAVAQPQVLALRFEVDSVRAQRTGDIAIVEYRRADHRHVPKLGARPAEAHQKQRRHRAGRKIDT